MLRFYVKTYMGIIKILAKVNFILQFEIITVDQTHG